MEDEFPSVSPGSLACASGRPNSSVPDASTVSQPAASQPKRPKLTPGELSQQLCTDGVDQCSHGNSHVTDAQKYRQPSPRSYHCASAIGGKVVMWGGRTSRLWNWEEVAPFVEVFDVHSRHWEQWKTTGPPPTGLESAACASVEEHLFVYGGDIHRDEPAEGGGKLHRLNTRTLQWAVMSPHNSAAECPMAMSGCSMTAIGEQLALLGGIGRSKNSPVKPGSSFIDDDESDCRWTNEFHLYSLREDRWISPVTTGERPPPCSGCSLTSIDHRRAVMFGGSTLVEDYMYMDDVYTIDVQTMHWTKLEKSESGPWPVERAGHAACCLNHGQEHPRILVIGGVNYCVDIYGEIPGDDLSEELEYIWILDVESETWIKAGDTPLVPCRYNHTATAVDVGRSVTEVVIFGGLEKCWRIDETTILTFGIGSLFHLCVNYILNNYSFYQPLLQQFLPQQVQTHIHQEREKQQRTMLYKEKQSL